LFQYDAVHLSFTIFVCSLQIDERSINNKAITPPPSTEESSPFNFRINSTKDSTDKIKRDSLDSNISQQEDEKQLAKLKSNSNQLQIPGNETKRNSAHLNNENSNNTSVTPRSRPPSAIYKSRPPSALFTNQNNNQLVAFWSFTDAEGNRRSVFNSLPRSFYQSLPRRVMHQYNNKNFARDSSNLVTSEVVHTSMISKNSFPPPTCTQKLHDNGFHEVNQPHVVLANS